MNQLLASLPKTVVALGAIALGFLLIVLFDPPRTVCDSQMELFREAQKTFLYPSSQRNIQKPPLIKELHAICQHDNSPGGCFELFQSLKKLSVDLDNIPRQCSEKAAGEAEIQQWLPKSLKLMVQIAWGEKSPLTYAQRHAWFDASDVALYCDLRKNAIRIFGESWFAQWRESIMKELPQADRMPREQLWQKSIFSTACDAFR